MGFTVKNPPAGLLVDNAKSEDAEPNPEPAGSGSPQAAAPRVSDTAGAAAAQSLVALNAMQSQVKMMSLVIGGLAVLNAGLVFALMRSKR